MQEYCQWETFNATCSGPNEIVLITAARYGRMRVSRCISQGSVTAVFYTNIDWRRKFSPKFVKCCRGVKDRGQHFTNSGDKILMMSDDVSHGH